MGRRDALTKGLAITGTVLIWIPLLLPVVFGLARYARAHMFQVDYLMPAELSPVVALGGGLILWAALRARSRQKLTGWGLGVALVALVVSQVIAVVTGLASGESEAVGWRWALVVGVYALYPLALILVGVGGVLLLRDLFGVSQSASAGA